MWRNSDRGQAGTPDGRLQPPFRPFVRELTTTCGAEDVDAHYRVNAGYISPSTDSKIPYKGRWLIGEGCHLSIY